MKVSLQVNLTFFSAALGQIFWSIVGIEFGVMLRVGGPYKPEIAYILINNLMIYTDPIEYNIIGDTRAPMLS